MVFVKALRHRLWWFTDILLLLNGVIFICDISTVSGILATLFPSVKDKVMNTTCKEKKLFSFPSLFYYASDILVVVNIQRCLHTMMQLSYIISSTKVMHISTVCQMTPSEIFWHFHFFTFYDTKSNYATPAKISAATCTGVF